MKLLTRYNRINLVVIILIFLLASLAYYYSLDYIVIDQMDDDLRIEQREIQTYVKEHNRLPEIIQVRDQIIQYNPLVQQPGPGKYQTIHMYDSLEKGWEAFRQLKFSVMAGGRWYEVSVFKSLEATDHLIHSILIITFGTILLILIASFTINRIILKKLWKPFYVTLDAIRNFKVGKAQKISFAPTAIEEFNFMNETLRNATHQAQYDYAVLKEFTENAAHELQTPLAVIRSKLDLMIQDEELSESHTHTLLTTYKAIDKLSRLNQSLLLLAKIENKQYDETQAVDLKKKLEEKIEEFEELWASQELKVSSHLKSIQRTMNPELAEILLNNLLSNATRHNYPGGQIRIKLTEQSLIVANTSPHSELDHSRLFTRFYKPAPHNENNGLGLSIIKQICEVSGFQISYSRKDQMHEFKILWKHDY